MSTIINPTVIDITARNILQIIREFIIKKHPDLAEEEFEINMVYDSYAAEHRANIVIID